jgi:ribonucleoside-triphosphate reductase (formate)
MLDQNNQEQIGCGEKTEVYTRVVGFYRPINQWNEGKKEEFYDRNVYQLPSN